MKRVRRYMVSLTRSSKKSKMGDGFFPEKQLEVFMESRSCGRVRKSLLHALCLETESNTPATGGLYNESS